MTNNYRPHVLVLPADDANADMANGFLLHDQLDARSIRILNSAGGWPDVRDDFVGEYLGSMRRFENRHMILLVDFDQKEDRFEKMTVTIPADVRDRVFVIGVWEEAVTRAGLGSREESRLQVGK